ncbi:MAG: host attachment protein [Rhodospirillales bacterium]
MPKKIRTWVVVADGAHAKAYLNEGPGTGLAAVPEMELAGTRALDRDIHTDRSGRQSNVPGGAARHAVDPRENARNQVERSFIREVADALAAAERDDAFDRLVVVAAPHALGDLRSLLPDAVARKVVAEIDRDYVHLSPKQLAEHLGDVVRT